MRFLYLIFLCVLTIATGAANAAVTKEPDATRMTQGGIEFYHSLHRYLSHRQAELAAQREKEVKRLLSLPEDELAPVIDNYRVELQDVLGVPDECGKSTPPKLIKKTKIDTDMPFDLWRLHLSVCEGLIDSYGILGVPKSATAPLPLVMAIHGTAAGPERLLGLDSAQTYTVKDYHHEFAKRLLEEGYAVYVPQLITETTKKKDTSYEEYRNALDMRGRSLAVGLMGAEVGTLTSAMDYLTTLPEIDANNIGVYGISLGGTIAHFLAAIDTRFDAVVLSQWVEKRSPKLAGYDYKAANWKYPLSGFIIPWAFLEKFDDVMLSFLVAPAGLFIEAGKHDGGNRTDGAKNIYPMIRKIYEHMGLASKDACLEIGDASHEIVFKGAKGFLDYRLRNKTSTWNCKAISN